MLGDVFVARRYSYKLGIERLVNQFLAFLEELLGRV